LRSFNEISKALESHLKNTTRIWVDLHSVMTDSFISAHTKASSTQRSALISWVLEDYGKALIA
jgi:CRISPR/Cas system-associated endonuclease Cas3-HD